MQHRPTAAPATLLLSTALALAACSSGADPTLGPNGVTLANHGAYFKLTASHTSLTCYACHDTTNTSFALTNSGVSCTASACHPDPVTSANHSSIQGFGYDTPDCINCHKDGAGVVDHTFFPIAATTTHGNVPCSVCHGPTRAVADLQCTGCHDGTHPHADQAHVDQVHTSANVAGYVYASPSCYECHKDGTAGLPPGHDIDDFPITGTKHAGVGCSQCHGADKTLANVSCTSGSCHPAAESATQHSGIPATGTAEKSGAQVTNYQWSTTYCLRCHADGRGRAISSTSHAGQAGWPVHPRVKHGITGRDHGPHCLICHPNKLATGKTWSGDFSDNVNVGWTCLGCHDSNNPD